METALQQLGSLSRVTFHEPPIEEVLLLEHLRTQKVDLIIDSVFPEEHAFIVEHLYDEEVVAVCRMDHPRINGSLSQQQFYSESHVLYQMTRKNISGLKFKADRVKKRNIKMEVSSLANVLLTVAKTDYISACSRTLAENWADILKIQVFKYPVELPRIPINMVYHRRFLNDPVHKQVREEIKSILS
ncbi:LysR substrate-binding domain-containing protein [Psychromonas ossibalaenae]|uniref:LysR substrate-binding domain-containing protein n=1 Tax=Psychromonas ossibalaenae TaxID=444922 RepID=UPI0003A6247D|nr:LysR substrate-binding domain-containing protein [Psychromonas ossibalaenae]